MPVHDEGEDYHEVQVEAVWPTAYSLWASEGTQMDPVLYSKLQAWAEGAELLQVVPSQQPDDDPIVERAICSRHGELAVRREQSGWKPPIIPPRDPNQPKRKVWCSDCFDAFLSQHMEPVAFNEG